ncbi:Multiple EGF-like-domain protein 3 precursor [Minicystis rosea]|nr:Multiple EGF-like-domain protein 3 precursor [Minicystis rosea]
MGVVVGCGSGETPGGGGSGGGTSSSTTSTSSTGGAGPSCGDGKVDATETCDDGNATEGDGCSKGCVIESGFTCSGEPSVCAPTCGDGIIAGAEACDDGNANDGDGCAKDCTSESGYSCDGLPSTCVAVCGDGLVVGAEACDDTNTTDGDGCSAACAVEDGWSCDTAMPTICGPVIGDGKIVGSEACDDGNTASGDGCSSAGEIESGWGCTGAPSVCVTECGDGIIAGAETCDDGNASSGDGCDETCTTIEPGFSCDGAPSICATHCGDGIVAGSETCDDGGTNAGDGCDAACATESGWQCSGAPSACAPTCGDGVLLGAETCDDGNTASGDGCSSACAAEPGWYCAGAPSTCTTHCGDGVIAGSETCDDGNTSSGDGCSSTCGTEAGWHCAGAPSTCATQCGDGVLAGAETCDDGNASSGDGCSSACVAELGYTCAGTGPGSCVTTCGDGITAGSETCDDENHTPGDGCDASCQKESGYACSGAPSVCAAVCGDGIKLPGEKCDDGNLVNGDGCSATCQIEPGFEIEPNNTLATANPFDALAIGGKINGNIKPAGDKDIFSFEVPIGSTGLLTAQTINNYQGNVCGATTASDTVLTLFDASSNELVTNDDISLGSNWCSSISSATLDPGTYYIQVTHHTATSTLAYTLQANLTLAICGNGVVELAEQCDDGNTANGDGCSALCKMESTPEAEPNNSCAAANGPTQLPPNTLFAGSIGTAGDQDWYAIVLPNYADLRLQTFDETGPGSCATGHDSELQAFNSSCTSLGALNDDGGVGLCSLLDPTASTQTFMRHLAPGTYYAMVRAHSTTATFSYTLLASLTALCGNGIVEGSEQCDGTANCGSDCMVIPGCGNGLKETGEQCDDGNTANGDGCSDTCQWETIPEVEPNGTTAQADVALPVITGDARITGAITPTADLDIFKLSVATQGVVRFEVFDTTGIDCSTSIITAALNLKLLNASGTQLKQDIPSGDTVASGISANCPALVVDLAPGTYYLQVAKTASGTVAAYHLQVKFEANNGNEVEPNDTRPTATPKAGTDFFVYGDHQTGTDIDVFEVTVPPGALRSIRAEVIEGDTSKTCESGGIDSFLTLYSATGTSLVTDDDDGRGFCSAIDGTGASPRDSGAHNLSPGKYYLELKRSSLYTSPDDIFNYKLAVTIR